MSSLMQAVQALYEPNSTARDFFDALDNRKEHLSDMAAAEADLDDSFDADPIVKADEPHKISDAKKAIAFMLAGNAYFTIRSIRSGVRYTFRVSVNKIDEKQVCKWCHRVPCTCPPIYFVSMLTGSQNESDYSYMGIIKDKNQFQWTKKSRFDFNSTAVQAFRWMFERLAVNHMPTTMELWHEGRCGRCGRKLTVPESIEAGIGPECATRLQ